MIGQIVGTYKITEKIGEGGMGAVFKGVDLMLERDVAIKVLRPELAGQPEIVERFRAEAVTLARLNHPRIATLYSFFRHGNDFLMVMEFVRGLTLGDVIAERGAIPCEQAVPMFCQALEGIEHAHSLGIIHRDVKPANMMLTGTGAVKVMDFGIARVLGAARMTKAGHLVGTIEYMSPEQVRGKQTDARSDIYSAGIVLYEMLTGRVPFSSDSEYDLMRQQIEEAPPPPRQFLAGIPDLVEGAILRSLAKKPEDRFETAGEFRAALLSALSHSAWNPVAATSAQVKSQQSEIFHSRETPAPKETVLAASKSGPHSYGSQASSPGANVEAQIKGTRLVSAESHPFQSNAPFEPMRFQPTQDVSTGVSSKLNWKYFAVAAGALLVFSVMIIASAAFMLSGDKKPAVVDAPKPKETPLVVQQPSPVPPANNPVAEATSPSPGNPAQSSTPQTAEEMGIKVTNTNGSNSENQTTNTRKTAKAENSRRTKADNRGNNSGQQHVKTDNQEQRRQEALRHLDN